MVRAHKLYNDFSAASAPFRADVELEDVEVEGEIPKELNGTFYRVMQDPYYDRDYYLSGSKTIPFDGDGSISAFRVKDGKVSFQQRYVMTERLVAERKAGKALFGMFRSPFSHHPCVRAVQDSTANTNIILHAGKLWPCESMAQDMSWIRFKNHRTRHFSGTNRPHPSVYCSSTFQVDPTTGDLCAFGYGLKGLGTPQMSVYIIDKNGEKIYSRDFEFDRDGDKSDSGMIHDCAITENYVILYRIPFLVDTKDVEKPGNHQWYYDDKSPAWFGLVPRDLSKPVRWFQHKNCMTIHSGASFEEKGKVYFDASVASHNAFSFLPCRHGPNPKPSDISVNYIRFCIDPSSESDVMPDPEVLLHVPCEFPRIDERFLTKRTRYTFLDSFKPDVEGQTQLYQGLNAIVRIDEKSKNAEFFIPGPNCLVQEPAFSPRSPDAPEGDGFLITMVDNLPLNRNEVIIQDTRDFQKVQAKIVLPFRLRSAVHGNWVDAERIPETETYNIQPYDDIYPNVPTVA